MTQECRSSILKFVAHSKRVLNIATRYGWLTGARYTNLRDVRTFETLGFLDIDWKNYDFQRHLEAAKATNPILTVARDIEAKKELVGILDQAYELKQFTKIVVIVPKDPALAPVLSDEIPSDFLLGYSVPTKYGGTTIPPKNFTRPVHLLGGRPDRQRKLAELMPVVSLDCNRFTLDASFGDYFDGEIFRPHPEGGYKRCIEDSVKNINMLWQDYELEPLADEWIRKML